MNKDYREWIKLWGEPTKKICKKPGYPGDTRYDAWREVDPEPKEETLDEILGV